MTGPISALFVLTVVIAVTLGLRAVPSVGASVADRLLGIVRGTAFVGALLLAASFVLPPGFLAGALAVPWLAVCGVAAAAGLVAALRDPVRFRPGPRHAVWVALAFLAVGATNAVADRLGVQPFGFAPTIVLLTAVHFHVAGFVLILAGALALERRPRALTGAALGMTIVGMPVTALGFFGVPLAAWLGALLVSSGGIGIGIATIAVSRAFASQWGRRLARIAGVSIVLAMALSIAYSTGSWLGATWLDIPTMARTHGVLNALGFAIPVVVAWTLERMVTSSPSDQPARPTDVLGFNVAPFVLGPTIALLAAAASLAPVPQTIRLALLVGAFLALAMTIGAALTTWWVFGRRADRRWDWVREAAGHPRRWINLTTGFDDSSATLRRTIPGDGMIVDVFDTTADHEEALLRARRRFPAATPSVPPAKLDHTIDPGAADVVFLLMAAHETHGSVRLSLLRSAARALMPDGRLILVEHLRDPANVLAFGPGAWHFSSRSEWLAAAGDAGLQIVDEVRLTPFVAGFAFARRQDR